MFFVIFDRSIVVITIAQPGIPGTILMVVPLIVYA